MIFKFYQFNEVTQLMYLFDELLMLDEQLRLLGLTFPTVLELELMRLTLVVELLIVVFSLLTVQINQLLLLKQKLLLAHSQSLVFGLTHIEIPL